MEYRALLDGIQVSFGWNTGLFWMEHRALLDGIQGSFGWNTGLFWMEYRALLDGIQGSFAAIYLYVSTKQPLLPAQLWGFSPPRFAEARFLGSSTMHIQI